MNSFFDSLNQAYIQHYKDFFEVRTSGSYFFYFTGAVIAILVYLFFNQYSIKKIYRRSSLYVKSHRFRDELIKDFNYIPVRVIITALIIFIFGYNYPGLKKLFASLISPYIDLPNVIHVEGILGQVIYTFFIVLFIDLGEYVGHYGTHRIDNLWIFHKMHHRCTSLNSLTKVRFHPVDLYFVILTRLGVSLPCILIFNALYSSPKASPITTVFVVGTLYFFSNHLRHSSIRLHYPRLLSYVFVSPAMHQVHHSINPKHYDKNFGTVFAFWDWMFGTLHIPKKNEYFKFGLIEDRNIVTSLWYDLYIPFIEIYNKYKSKLKGKLSPQPLIPVIHQEHIKKPIK